MNSDYIARLRSELLRAGASRQPWWRGLRLKRRLRPLVAVAAVATVAAALVLAVPGQRSDDRAVEPTFRVAPGDTEAAERIIRTRLAALGIEPESVNPSDGDLQIAVPPSDMDEVEAMLEPGRLAIYDWEASVLGPAGRPAADDESVTGGAGAGQEAATTKRSAQARADKHRDARVVKAPGGWFALADAPALTNADVARARTAVDVVSQEPVVDLDLTSQGRRAFTELTRTLTQRGADNALGGDPLATSQHFAIVVDDRIVSVPFINWRDNPDGLDGAGGMHIAVDTEEAARRLAALLSAGPLP